MASGSPNIRWYSGLTIFRSRDNSIVGREFGGQ